MIRAKHSRLFDEVFNVYMTWKLRANFQSIETLGNIALKDMPLLIIANHISWWDGFWILQLNRKYLKRRFHVMMLEEQLRKNMFLRKLGAFSLKPRSRSMIETLEYGAEILSNPANTLLVFPQGQISSQYSYPFLFQNGWSRIVERTPTEIQILMIAHLLDYSSSSKPTLRQYTEIITPGGSFSVKNTQDSYNSFFSRCLEQQTNLQ